MSFAFTAHLPLSRHEIDRDGVARANPALFDQLWQDEATRLLPVWGGKVLLAPAEQGMPRLALCAPSQVPTASVRVYLGLSLATDAAEPVGTPLVAVSLDNAAAAELEPDESRWVSPRTVVAELADRDAGACAEALGVLNWHASHIHCPRCGSTTRIEDAGWTRRCPNDGSQVFPRTDPAVIVLITDQSDRILLGSNAMWEHNRYSLLAGFVEPGESLEAAVVREMEEESGLRVTDAQYLGSQPWPFPASLMCGFTARLADDQSPHDLVPDGEEILDLRWFSRDELRAEAERILLPGASSIARAMIDHWLAGHGHGDDQGVEAASPVPR
ncbi:NAD(+) diphosphatase [Glaciibacter psychrotolerans]|uniref:NAD(+) diphosphatase n=1 Tax=Glaciibacter psychrotolerans TaxID=670054 RepID=A0A7Z0EDY6_9MICO|nr:NAD+ diphosphatase [Leifsonia psychrotolerans]